MSEQSSYEESHSTFQDLIYIDDWSELELCRDRWVSQWAIDDLFGKPRRRGVFSSVRVPR